MGERKSTKDVQPMTKNQTRYEIRLGGETKCASSLPCCGYPVKTLRQMMADGYQYVVDGKTVRKV